MFLSSAIFVYQKTISPFFGNRCRFHPSCSVYAAKAFQEQGLLKGLGLTIFRLLRCQPFCEGGFDPVPLKREKK